MTTATNRCCRGGNGRERHYGSQGVERTWARGCRWPREGLLPGDVSHDETLDVPRRPLTVESRMTGEGRGGERTTRTWVEQRMWRGAGRRVWRQSAGAEEGGREG
jgi:hypothetical protein